MMKPTNVDAYAPLGIVADSVRELYPGVTVQRCDDGSLRLLVPYMLPDGKQFLAKDWDAVFFHFGAGHHQYIGFQKEPLRELAA